MFLKKNRNIICLLGGLVSLFLLNGCYSESESNAQKNDTNNKQKTELVFANFRDIRDLNPHLYGGEIWAQNMIYESLVNIDNDGSIKPWLAEKWMVSEDGKIYTFYLRQDVYFSDGEKFDAKSAKLNIDAIIDNKERHTWLELIRLIDKVEVVDSYTLKLSLKKAYYPMLTEIAVTRPFRFASPRTMKNGFTKEGVTSFVGTGPWVLEQHKIDEYAIFTVNSKYWGEKPKLKQIKMKVIPDSQTRIMALQKGEIDLIFGKNMIDADSFERLDKDIKFHTTMSGPTSTRMLLMNATSGALKDIKVRQALEYAVNKQAISEKIFNGSESPADTLLAKSVPYCNIDLKPYLFDMKKAVVLLEEAGWMEKEGALFRTKDGKPLVVRLNYNSNSALEKTISEFIQSEFIKIGVDLSISGEEEQSYRDRQKVGNFDMIFNISWGTPYDPQSSISSMKLPVYGDYTAQQGLKNKKALDDAITDVLVSIDHNKRQELYTYILTTLHNEAIYIPLTYERNRAIYTSDLNGVYFNSSQFEIPFEKMYFK